LADASVWRFAGFAPLWFTDEAGFRVWLPLTACETTTYRSPQPAMADPRGNVCTSGTGDSY